MANGIKIGTYEVSSFKVGSGDCKVYLGDTLLYPQNISKYFTIRSLDDNNAITITNNTSGITSSFSYSLDNGETWTDFTISTGSTQTFNLSSGYTVSLKGTNTTLGERYDKGHNISSTGDFEVEGNIMSLLNGNITNNEFTDSASRDNFSQLFSGSSVTNAENLVLADNTNSNCYNSMFRACTSLTKPPKELPALTLAGECYSSMFEGCTALTEMPDILATSATFNSMQRMFCMDRSSAVSSSLTTLKPLHISSCNGSKVCSEMFKGNASLTTVPSNILPATDLSGASSCYYGMFQNCTSLTTAPELPATTLASSCYYGMFSGCSGLTTAPSILPATDLSGASSCYYGMFQNCTSLTTAPELPATTLVSSCYMNMFNGCSSLNAVTCLATNISAYSCLTGWLLYVSSTGTFTKAASMDDWTEGGNGIPSGWTVQDYTG